MTKITEVIGDKRPGLVELNIVKAIRNLQRRYKDKIVPVDKVVSALEPKGLIKENILTTIDIMIYRNRLSEPKKGFVKLI